MRAVPNALVHWNATGCLAPDADAIATSSSTMPATTQGKTTNAEQDDTRAWSGNKQNKTTNVPDWLASKVNSSAMFKPKAGICRVDATREMSCATTSLGGLAHTENQAKGKSRQRAEVPWAMRINGEQRCGYLGRVPGCCSQSFQRRSEDLQFRWHGQWKYYGTR